MPTVIAFSAGGFFEGARLRAGIVCWALVVLLAFVSPVSLSRPMRLSLACLVGWAAWMSLSILWAPLRDGALGDAERLWFYAGYAIAAALALRGRALAWIEPALAVGGAVVGAYALATRLLPTVVPSTHSLSAGARLDQPLTYWNSLGLLMAMTAVLLIRIATAPEHAYRFRTLAAALVPIPGLALYLTFSRGAVAVLGVGVIVFVALTRQRRATAIVIATVGCAGAAAVAASRFPAVDSLEGSATKQGAAMLVILLVLCAIASVLHVAIEHGAVDRFRLRSRAGAAGLVVVAVLAAGAVVAATHSPGTPSASISTGKGGVQLPSNSARLSTLKTNRPSYWKVALQGFADNPLKGVGGHGFQQLWLQKRHISESVQDAHELYLETAAELGIVGLLLLAGWLAGIVQAFLRLLRRPGGRIAYAGVAAASGAFLVHAGLDWDWEMPGVSLPFLALAAALLGAAADGELERAGGQHDQRGLGPNAEARDPVDRDADDRDRHQVGREGPHGQPAAS